MCEPILVTQLKMQPHYSQSSRENATPSSGTSPSASYKEVLPPLPPKAYVSYLALKNGHKQNTHSKSGAENSIFQFSDSL